MALLMGCSSGQPFPSDILPGIPEIACRMPRPVLVLKAPLWPEHLLGMLVDSDADPTLDIHRSSRSLA